MPDITQLSDEELMRLAGQTQQSPDITQLSDEDLQRLAKDQQPDSIMKSGLGYIKEHPFKTNFQSGIQTLLGKSGQDIALGATQPQEPPVRQNQTGTYMMPTGKDMALPYGLNAISGMVGSAADIATNPSTYEAAGLLKLAAIPMKAMGGALKNVAKYANKDNQVKLAEEAQNALLSRRHNVVENYGKEYDNIVGKSDAKISLNDPIKNLVDESTSLLQNPEFSQQIALKNPQAKRVFDLVNKMTAEGTPEEIGVSEANDLQKFIKGLPSIKTKLAQGSKYGFHNVNWTNDERILLNFANDLKGQIIEAHPELMNLNKEYGSFMNAYKRVAPEVKIGSTVNKLKKYGELDPQLQGLFEKVFPKSTMVKIKEFNQADKTAELLKKIGLAGLGTMGLGEAGRIGLEHHL